MQFNTLVITFRSWHCPVDAKGIPTVTPANCWGLQHTEEYNGNLLTESVGEMGTIASGVVADPNWRY